MPYCCNGQNSQFMSISSKLCIHCCVSLQGSEYLKVPQMRPIVALMWAQDLISGVVSSPGFERLRDVEYIMMTVVEEDHDFNLKPIPHLSPEMIVDMVEAMKLVIRMVDDPKFGEYEVEEELFEYPDRIEEAALGLLGSLKGVLITQYVEEDMKNFSDAMTSLKTSMDTALEDSF